MHSITPTPAERKIIITTIRDYCAYLGTDDPSTVLAFVTLLFIRLEAAYERHACPGYARLIPSTNDNGADHAMPTL